MYGRDPQLPAKAALCSPVVRSTICIDDYKSQMQQTLSAAWKLAQEHIKKAQQRQKVQHDKKAKKKLSLLLETESLYTCLLLELDQLINLPDHTKDHIE